MRGDAIVYLWNKTDVDDAIGYHEKNNRGVPYGFVFTSVAEEVGEPWSVTLSHEVLELIGDPETNLLVMGPHPTLNRTVFHWFEMSDAVQSESYKIDGVAVSNFVLPLYFTGTRDTDEVGARNDFLGTIKNGKTLTSFGINPGGYIGFYDPKLGKHQTFSIKGDMVAQARLAAKSLAQQTRRSVRYNSVKEGGARLAAPSELGVKKAAFALAANKTTAPEYAPMDTVSKVKKPQPLKSGRIAKSKPPVKPKAKIR